MNQLISDPEVIRNAFDEDEYQDLMARKTGTWYATGGGELKLADEEFRDEQRSAA